MRTSNLDWNRLSKNWKIPLTLGKLDLLWAAIFIGTIYRFCYPFYFHPLDHLYSDPLRHYLNAGVDFNKAMDSFFDPPFPQFWLRAMLSLFTDTRTGVSAYFGLLCAATPWFWYLWGRLLFPSGIRARFYLACLIFLPSWIGIYGFFMDETLLLPALGLALWLSWRAKEVNTMRSLLLAIAAWALALSIKLNTLPFLAIVVPWLFFNFLKQHDFKRQAWVTISAAVLILLATYLAFPLWVYQGLGTTWLCPPGLGIITRAHYYSGSVWHAATILSSDKYTVHLGACASNAELTQTFNPFSDWITWRSGAYNLIIDCREKPFTHPQMPSLTLQKRLLYIIESAIYFFFSPSWPDQRVDDIINISQVETRWIWSMLTFFIIGLAWQKKRLKDIVVILCLGSALLYIFNDSTTIEGRYRKPWEGVALAAFIYLFNAPPRNRIE